jgi:phage protein U
MTALMMLGPVQFRIQGLNPQGIQTERSVPFAEHKVIGSEPVKEFMGAGNEKIKIKGTIFPFHSSGAGGLGGVAALKAARDAAIPLPFIRGGNGGGGWYLIESVDVDESSLASNSTGREISFTVSLCSVPTPGSGILGQVLRLFGVFG